MDRENLDLERYGYEAPPCGKRSSCMGCNLFGAGCVYIEGLVQPVPSHFLRTQQGDGDLSGAVATVPAATQSILCICGHLKQNHFFGDNADLSTPCGDGECYCQNYKPAPYGICTEGESEDGACTGPVCCDDWEECTGRNPLMRGT